MLSEDGTSHHSSSSSLNQGTMAASLSILNNPPQTLEGPQFLHRLVDWEKYSSSCAIDFSSGDRRERYTYQQVRACSTSLVSKIQKVSGASFESKQDQVIPVLVPQSPGLYISQLAILESGAAFCPINLDAPKDRIKFVVEDVAADIIVTTTAFRDVVSWDNGPAVIFVDEFPLVPLEIDLRLSPLTSVVNPKLAYIMYTSGSSGTPKGVAVSHLAVTQSLMAHQKHIPQFKRFLQFASPSFDVSVFEIFFPLIRGCTLVGCDRAQLLNNLPGMINALEVDAAELTPTVAGSLLQKRSAAPGLKLLLTIGEMLTRPLVEEFGGSDSKESMLYGMYGPTEAAIHCTICPKMQSNYKASNIGIPLDTTSIFIAKPADGNEALEFLPTGEIGELVLGGPQLAEGYLNREEQNKAAFVRFQEERYYRTGDKAKLLPDGTIEIHGRISAGQVKLRGQRVELGEIEEAVYKHPGIKTVVAIVLGSVLVAFALVDDDQIRAADVLNTCATWLPKFMVPNEIVMLKSFPYLPSGKVDKRRLQSDYEKQRAANETESVENESETEKIVREILGEFLGAFHTYTRLAAAGLESLTAIRVASRLKSVGFNVTTIVILQAATFSELVAVCEASKTSPKEPSKEESTTRLKESLSGIGSGAEGIEYIMPCTPLQLAMLSETAINEKAYQNWVEIDLTGVLGIPAAVTALNQLAEVNPILRTGFREAEDKDGYVQIVWKAIPTSNIREVDMFDYDLDISRICWLEHPIQVQLLKLDDSIKILLHIHHALYDAWSLELILDDFNSLLSDRKPVERIPFIKVVSSYANGILDVDSWKQKDYWRDHLQQLDIRPMPNYHNRKSPKNGLIAAEIQTSILTVDVEATARRLHSSPQSLLQSAYAVILSSYLGSADICFGTVFSGRTLPIEGIEDIVGPCLATLPVRIDLSTCSTVQELLQTLNSINRKHLEHSTLPLRTIKSSAGVDPRHMLFDTLFVWQQTLHEPTHSREHVSLVHAVDNLEFNLTLEVTPGSKYISLKANYRESVFPESQIGLLLSQLEQAVHAILQKDTLTYQDVYLCLEDNILSIENGHPDMVLSNKTLASPVEEIARVDPDRRAIDFAIGIAPGKVVVQRMSYSGLNKRANQIGHYLLGQLLAPDQLVCICMEKSLDLYSCILATAKVGAAYLPLTPDVPQERLERILNQAKVNIVLMDSTSKSRLKIPESVKTVYVDEMNFDIFCVDNIVPRGNPDNLAYCVFTSGSTGNPKGVLVTQRNIVSNLDVLERLYPASQCSRFLQQCSQAFDVSVFEIFFTWRIGGCLCAAVKDVLFQDIETAIRELEITHLSMTPTVAALVNPGKVPKVQFLVTAGEAVTPKVFNAWAGRGLFQGYGPSETTNICTLNENVVLDHFINNIGHPFENTSAFILSPEVDFVLLPKGAEGEFCFVVSSDHVWTNLEQIIATALAHLVKVPIEEIGPGTSFFSLGVDSISAIPFSKLLTQTSMHEVKISDILKYSTVIRLAEHITSLGEDTNNATIADHQGPRFEFPEGFTESIAKRLNRASGDIERVLPCTPLQEAMLSAADWIEDQVKQYGTSLLAACQTSWAAVLSEQTYQDDVCFGNVVNGRTVNIEGIEHLVAPCFNTIPVRLRDTSKLSYLESFRHLQLYNADSLQFQFTPLRRILARSKNDGPHLFDTLFLLQQTTAQLDSSIWFIDHEEGIIAFPLVCEVVPDSHNNKLGILFHSYGGAIDDQDLSKIANEFIKHLEISLENPRRQILPQLLKEHILEKRSQRYLTKSKESETAKHVTTMTQEQLKLRNVIAAFTDTPRDSIGPDVTVFRLGLDSISVVQLAYRLRDQGYDILASDILEHPTISQLNLFLQENQSVPKWEKSEYNFEAFSENFRNIIYKNNNIDPKAVQYVRPCTAVQGGMLAQTLRSDGKEYMNSIHMKLMPTTSISKLKMAWEQTIKDHEMLRTGFVPTGDLEYPFAMVTYFNDKFSTPWIEDSHINPSTLERLAQGPWGLRFTYSGDETVLIFEAHHAMYDAQSIQIILSDVADIYNSRDRLSSLPVNSLLGPILLSEANDLDSQRLFWQNDDNKVIVNRFPNLCPLHSSSKASIVKEIYSTMSVSELDTICRQLGVTMQAAGQAAWARLLAAYTGETDTTFGVTLSGRSLIENSDKVCFPSIVTLPVRGSVVGTNEELLSRTMQNNASLMRYQFTPLTSIQKWAGFPEGRIFDTLFTYQRVAQSERRPSRPWDVIDEHASVEYVVSLEMEPTNTGKLLLRLTCREDIVPTEHSGLLLEQYNLLLLDILQNPQDCCDIAPTAQDTLLSITPAEYSELPSPVELLHEFVKNSAQQWPDKIALEFATSWTTERINSKTWTYREMNLASNKIANFLLDREVLPGDIVAICFDKCAEASLAIIGILKAGCAYVALDPTAPAERLNFIVKDSNARLLLTSGNPAKSLQSFIQIDPIDLSSSAIIEDYNSDTPKLSREVSPLDTSYCLYTSGTTGTPKGCLISHENAVQAMLAFQKLFTDHWDEESKWLQFASFHFDVSVLEQFWSWSVGIRVISAPRDLIFEDIAASISILGVTHIDLTPSLARLLHPNDVPSLHKGVFITGGEQLKQEILDVWGKYGCIYNGYGPTEATIGVTMYPRVPHNGKPSNIGPQFLNVGSFVLKPGTELPVLRGGVGELCVSGKLVGIGYLNRPELTAERFPVLESFKERVYRTGDLVRILHDGSFIFLGRADDQVKLRGQRLELSEINEVIKKSCSSIDEVVTLVLKHLTQQKEQLVSFFVVTVMDQQELPHIISTMKHACKSRLPGYMVPTHFIPIEKLPLNPNNKADTKQLATMFNNLSIDELQSLSRPGHSDGQWPENHKELLHTIATVLKVEATQLQKDSNIFELGLDSISVIGFSASLQRTGLHNAKPSTIMQNPTLGQLVETLSKGRSVDNANEDSHIESIQYIKSFSYKHLPSIARDLGMDPTDIDAISPCTPMQEGMIYQFLESEYPLYFNKFTFKLDDSVDTDKLLRAWNKVVAQLPILRTRFMLTDDGYAQVATKARKLVWDASLFKHDAENKNLSLQFPFRISLKFFSLERRMNIEIFHGLYDANSLIMILRHVIEEYRGIPNIDYGPSFVESLAYGLLASRPGAQTFWADHLKSWAEDSLSIKYEGTSDVAVTKELPNMNKLEERRTSFGVTYQAMIMAAWVSILRNIKHCNPTLGLVVSGRNIDFGDADKVAGPLFNTIPFHIDIEPKTTWQQLIQKCHDFNIHSQLYQQTPLKEIQKWGPARKSRNPIFDNLFVFQRSLEDENSFADDIWVPLEDSAPADYPLAFEATLGHDLKTLKLSITAQGSILSESECHDLLEQMEISLKNITENPMSYIPETGDMPNGENHEQPSIADKLTNGVSNHKIVTSDERKSSQLLENIQILRQDISILANISENDVHEESSIFEHGLDSIDIIKLSSRLRKQGIRLPVSDIIRSQTVVNMAGKIVRDDYASKEPSTKEIQSTITKLTNYLRDQKQLPSDFQMVLPATPLQQSMIKEMLRSEYKRYFNLEVLKISDAVDITTLKGAMEQVIAASPILRTNFVEVNDPKIPYAFAQVVHHNNLQPPESMTVTTIDGAKGLNDVLEDLKLQARWLIEKNGCLFQTYYLSFKGSNYIVMAIAHALYDGRSLQLLHDDIYRAYKRTLQPRPEPISFLGTILNSTTEEGKKFWKSALSNLPPARLPRKQNVQDTSIVHRAQRKSTISFQDIEFLCKSMGVSLQTISQTCFVFVLSFLMRQLDVVFGSVLSCRDSEEANEVMFPLMNTVAVRTVLHGTIADVVRSIQEQGDSARQYQHFPLGMAQSFGLAGRSAESTRGQVLFDALFIYQGRQISMDHDPLYQSEYGVSDVEFPLCVEMEISPERIPIWTIASKASIGDIEESNELLNMLDSVLARIISDPQLPSFVYEDDNISVCGLPKFRIKPDLEPTIEEPTQLNLLEWSDDELIIRKALHELSGFTEDSISKDTTIYQLGLDSILVLKLAALLKNYEIKLKVSEILQDLTISSISRRLSQTTTNGEEDIDDGMILEAAVMSLGIKAEDIKVDDIGKVRYIMPVTPGQQYMIRRWQASRGSMFYPTFTYRVSAGIIEKQRLESCWEDLRSRHDILRTGFIEVGTTLVQVVFDDVPDSNDLRSSKLVKYRDLRRPPVQLSVDEEGGYTVLKLVIHHALYDGMSIPGMIYELQSAYQGERLEFSTSSFKNFMARSLSTAQKTITAQTNGSAGITTTQQSWSDYLHGVAGHQVTAISQSQIRTEVFRPSLPIPPLRSLAQNADVSADALLLAAVAILYAMKLHGGIHDRNNSQVVLGIYLANRALFGEDLSRLVAPTFNILPLRVNNPLNRDIAEIARDIQDDIRRISSAAMSCASLDDIYRWTGVRVNFFVNILKDALIDLGASNDRSTGNGDRPGKVTFEAAQDFKEMSRVVKDDADMEMSVPNNGSCDAYLPSLDIEIKYSEDKVDFGIFGPDDMISIPEAEEMIQNFVNIWI
ncbi:hypothetical protein F5884DRAFT_733793 [Xylogone sp. PMI_703]|nr:hypothetical protein F5884DRAFT_733793 [Xylogone sp. PMI_703]